MTTALTPCQSQTKAEKFSTVMFFYTCRYKAKAARNKQPLNFQLLCFKFNADYMPACHQSMVLTLMTRARKFRKWQPTTPHGGRLKRKAGIAEK